MNPLVLALLAVTVLVECAVSLLVSPRWTGLPRSRLAGAVLLVNLASHPLAILAAGRGVPFAAVEAGVIVLEAGLLLLSTGLSPSRAIVLSVGLNVPTLLLSFLVPLFLSR